jgi:hypothetical protein
MTTGGKGVGGGNELPIDLIPVFDYGSINETHQQAASEIARMLDESGNEMLAELIKFKFNIKEPKKIPPTESIFVKICRENNIHITIQGYVSEGIDVDSTQYPIVSISEDVRVLDKLVTFIRDI